MQADAKLKQIIERLVGISMAGSSNEFVGKKEASLIILPSLRTHISSSVYLSDDCA